MAKKEIENEPMLEQNSDEILLEETSDTEVMLEESSNNEVLLEETSESETVMLEETQEESVMLEETSSVTQQSELQPSADNTTATAAQKPKARKATTRKPKVQASTSNNTTAANNFESKQETQRKTEAGTQGTEVREKSFFSGTISAIAQDKEKLGVFLLFGSTSVVFLISFVWGLFEISYINWLGVFFVSLLAAIPFSAATFSIVGTLLRWLDADSFERFCILFGIFLGICIFVGSMVLMQYQDTFETTYAQIALSLFFADFMWIWVLRDPKESFWVMVITFILIAGMVVWVWIKG